jgi:hypothetical protein
MHLFHVLVELFSFGFDVLYPCQSSIEMHAQVKDTFECLFFTNSEIVDEAGT